MSTTTLSQYLKQKDIRLTIDEVAENLGIHRATLYRKFDDPEVFKRELQPKLEKLTHENLNAKQGTKKRSN